MQLSGNLCHYGTLSVCSLSGTLIYLHSAACKTIPSLPAAIAACVVAMSGPKCADICIRCEVVSLVAVYTALMERH